MPYRIIVRCALAVTLACCAWGAHAQDVALETTIVATPAARETAPAPAPATAVDRWWVLFTDPVACDLGLNKTVLQELRIMDARHYEAYWDLGDEPSRDPRYVELSRRRTEEVKTILTAEQFRQWSAHYDPLRPR